MRLLRSFEESNPHGRELSLRTWGCVIWTNWFTIQQYSNSIFALLIFSSIFFQNENLHILFHFTFTLNFQFFNVILTVFLTFWKTKTKLRIAILLDYKDEPQWVPLSNLYRVRNMSKYRSTTLNWTTFFHEFQI